MVKFSVIVPCYNVEAYLDQCIESIISQDYEDFEVLLIDDGSNDGTGVKCDEWASKDERIHTFHKLNGGLSDARNYGMAQSQGEYLIFIDSDDFIESGAFSEIAKATDGEPDVITTRLIEYFGENDIRYGDEKMEESISLTPTTEEAIRWEVNSSCNTWPAPKKIVRRQFVVDNNLLFLNGYLHEDIDWTIRLLLVAKRYKVCSKPWYYHRMRRPGSITTTVKAKSITDVIQMAAVLCPLCSESNTASKELMTRRIMSSVFSSINKIKYLDKGERYLVVDCIKEHISIFKFTKKKSHKIFVFVMKIIGVKMACNILCMMK